MILNRIIIGIGNRLVSALIKVGIIVKKTGNRDVIIKENTINDLVKNHFEYIQSLDHINFKSMKLALNILGDSDSNSSISIIETGSAAHGTKSTLLFDSYLNYENQYNNKKCSLITCDIRINPMVELRNSLSKLSTCVCDDSVHFLEKLSRDKSNIYNNSELLIYLDSFDLDFENPSPSGYHGLKEFIAIEPLLKKGTLLLIDDSPKSIEFCPESQKNKAKRYFDKNGIMPGKGMYVKEILDSRADVELLLHEYQLLYKFN